jgi:hypothetical protein
LAAISTNVVTPIAQPKGGAATATTAGGDEMTNDDVGIQAEIHQVRGGEARCLILPIPLRTRAKLLAFAVENGIPERVGMDPDSTDKSAYSAEVIAISIILDRYFRMIESEQFRHWFNEG